MDDQPGLANEWFELLADGAALRVEPVVSDEVVSKTVGTRFLIQGRVLPTRWDMQIRETACGYAEDGADSEHQGRRVRQPDPATVNW